MCDITLNADIKISDAIVERLVAQNSAKAVIDFLCSVVIEGCRDDPDFYDDFQETL